MTTIRAHSAWLLLPLLVGAAPEGVRPSPPSLDSAPPATAAAPLRSAEELEQLVAPIALYPDALIALILPAATSPADIVLAARQVRESAGDRSQIEHRSWEESVKSLTYYPEVLRWLDENLEWTRQLGEAFAAQPADVMEAIQRLRARARAAGTLVETPQQQVLLEPEIIRIVPAQANAIYVPYYQPSLVFLPEPVWYGRPSVTFGVGLPVGAWLAYDCDWRRRTIWVGDRHRRWSGHDWRRPVVPIPAFGPGYARHGSVRPWTPPPLPVRPPRPVHYRPSTELLRPGPATVPLARIPHPPSSSPRAVPPTSSHRRPAPASQPGVPAAGFSTAVVAPPIQTVPAPLDTRPSSPPAATRRSVPEQRSGGESGGPPAAHRRYTPPATPGETPSRPGHSGFRHSPPSDSTSPRALPRATTSPPANTGAPAAPPARSRPSPPAPPAAAPSTPPASSTTPAARTEPESQRPIGRRHANDPQR